MHRCSHFLLNLIIYLTLFSSCGSKPSAIKEQYVSDLEQIKEKGELTVLTLSSSTSYFLYKDEPMGYDYDLAQDFCVKNDLRLKVKVAENVTQLVEMLNTGEGDLIAYALTLTNELKDTIQYCGHKRISHQVLVQRWDKKVPHINDVTDLIDKDVYVKADSKYQTRLENLNSELGGGINIKYVKSDTISVEDMIAQVASKAINYTVSDEYVAKLNKTYHLYIDVSLPISYDQRMSWAVRKTSPDLAKALDVWYKENNDSPSYKNITKKYFEESKLTAEEGLYLDENLPKGVISHYDAIFKSNASKRFEWQLLAAISYQESRFKNHLSSWAGAVGIMGLMPRTADAYGISRDDRLDPNLSVQAAVKLLTRLDDIFKKIENKEERQKFVLGSYNGGIGHVIDAQNLAEKYGADPHIWSEVKDYLRLKRFPEYFNDPVCKSGYFRGTETIRYVHDVTANIEVFKKLAR